LSCTPIPETPPEASGLESLSRCAAQVSFCLPEQLIPELLAERLSLAVGPITRGHLAAGQLSPVDADRDGVPDFLDQCPNTPSNSVVNSAGCSIEQLCPCAGPWRNHGEYVNCVKQTTGDFFRAGLITEAQRRVLLNKAAQSNCGKR
jgi:hypothetical protein